MKRFVLAAVFLSLILMGWVFFPGFLTKVNTVSICDRLGLIASDEERRTYLVNWSQSVAKHSNIELLRDLNRLVSPERRKEVLETLDFDASVFGSDMDRIRIAAVLGSSVVPKEKEGRTIKGIKFFLARSYIKVNVEGELEKPDQNSEFREKIGDEVYDVTRFKDGVMVYCD